jgi:DNA polymerase bacteriophage-type
MIFSLDYETYSEADLEEVGAARYAEDPSTEILLAGIAGVDGVVYVWENPRVTGHPADLKAVALLTEAFTNPESVIWAFSFMFEAFVTNARALKDLGLSPPQPHQWRCTQALARRAALPDSLAKLSDALDLKNKKDAKGGALIKLFSMPYTPRKKRGEAPLSARRVYPKDEPDKWLEFASYNRTDVLAEQEAHARLKPFEFKGDLLAAFQADWLMNLRGFEVDLPALNTAAKLIETETAGLREEFLKRAGCNPTQREAVKTKLKEFGLDLSDMTADTVAETVKTATGEAAELLRLYSQLQYSAAKKVTSMRAMACADSRVRGVFQFYGARSGRWSGRAVQPQNFKKNNGADKVPDDVYDYFQNPTFDLEAFPTLFGGPSELAAKLIRRFIRGPFWDYDYSAIEVRVGVWTARQEDIVRDFANGVDVYRNMAASICRTKAEDIKDKSPDYMLGKVTVLGAQYGLGPDKFFSVCTENFGLDVTKEKAAMAIATFREKFHRVKAGWSLIDRAAKDAVRSPGQWFTANRLRFISQTISGIPYLVMKLPSGRGIVYPYPEIKRVFKESFGDFTDELSFWGQIVGKSFYGRVSTYGGKIYENFCQGVAADIMAYGLVRATAEGFEPEMLVHDQMLARDPNSRGDELLKQCMVQMPPWADGLPLAVKGGREEFYS